METNLSQPSTAGSGSDSGSDSEELPEVAHRVRRTSGMRTVGSGARMSLLLQQMRGCV